LVGLPLQVQFKHTQVSPLSGPVVPAGTRRGWGAAKDGIVRRNSIGEEGGLPNFDLAALQASLETNLNGSMSSESTPMVSMSPSQANVMPPSPLAPKKTDS